MFKGALCHKGNQLKSTIGAVALQPQERPPETALCLFLKQPKRRYPASKRQTHIDQHRPTQLDTSKRSPLEMLRSFQLRDFLLCSPTQSSSRLRGTNLPRKNTKSSQGTKTKDQLQEPKPTYTKPPPNHLTPKKRTPPEPRTAPDRGAFPKPRSPWAPGWASAPNSGAWRGSPQSAGGAGRAGGQPGLNENRWYPPPKTRA